MRMAHVLMGAMLALVPSILIAQAVETSPRPVLRPVAIEAKFTKASAPFASLRPKIRPQRGQSATTSAVQKVVVEQTINADITARKVTKAEPLRNVVAQTHTGVVTVCVCRCEIVASEKTAAQVAGCDVGYIKTWARQKGCSI